MEWVKTAAYVSEATQYTPASIPSGEDYGGYSVSIAAQPINSPDDGLQQITVTVLRGGQSVYALTGFKGDR